MSDFRKRILVPALFPLAAFAFIGALAFALSRILLAVTTEGSVVVGVVMAACILFGAAAVAKGGTMKNVQKISLIAFSLMLLVGGIAVGASQGTRPVEGHVEPLEEALVAQNLTFQPTEVHAPADEKFGLVFENRDAGIQHNIAVFRAPDQTGEALFRGPLFPGVATRTFELPALPAASYFFWCDAHTAQMRGTLITGGAPGGPQAGGTTPPASPPATSPPTAPPPAGAPAASVTLIAKNLAFDKNSLAFPADTQVTVTLRNEDPGQLHNWALYRDSAMTQNIFRGDLFTGPAERKYVFTSPGPGTYYFRCDAHLNMTGTVTVT